jgi:putative acetyltransferase
MRPDAHSYEHTITLRDGEIVKLRRATNLDCDDARAIVFEVLLEYGLEGEADVTDACLKDIDASYSNNRGVFYMLTSSKSERPIGCFGLMSMPRPHGADIALKTCELRKMYVRKPFRGRGLGKPLMQFALTEAKRLGFQRVELDTASQLVEAISLYRKFGFLEFTHPHIPKRCDMAMALNF